MTYDTQNPQNIVCFLAFIHHFASAIAKISLFSQYSEDFACLWLSLSVLLLQMSLWRLNYRTR